jgi:hypothetical protein
VNPRFEAYVALDALGPSAAGDLSTLERILRGERPDPAALYLVARAGSTGVTVLERCLTNDSSFLSIGANLYLEMMRTNSEILQPRVPVDFNLQGFNRRITEVNLKILHASLLEYRKRQEAMGFPSNSGMQ